MTIILTTEEFRKYVPIDINTNIDNLTPFIEAAMLKFLQPLIGPEYVADLADDYNTAEGDPLDMDSDYALLLPYAQKVVANGAAYLSVNQIGVSVGDAGIQVNHGQNSEPAPRWKVDKLEFAYLMATDNASEELLKWLEGYATDDNMFADWLISEYNTLLEGLIVFNVAIASQHIDIADSRRIFLRLKKRIKQIEGTTIKRLLGQVHYDALIQEIVDGSVSPENEALIELCRPIISKKALFETMPFLRISIQDGAIVMFSTNDGVVTQAIASDKAISEMRTALKMGELGFEADIEALTQFILDNIDDYPDIKASGVYTSRAIPGPTYVPENNSSNKHFSV
jgi:hypothetical protein